MESKMPVEITDTGMVITGESIGLYRLLVIQKLMEVILKTGMRPPSRRNPFPVAAKLAGLATRSPRKTIYRAFCEKFERVADPELLK
jgi:hypothetical protein